MPPILSPLPRHPGSVAVGGRGGWVGLEAELLGRLGDAVDQEVLVTIVAVLAHDGAEFGQLAVQEARDRIPLVHHDLVQPVGEQGDVDRERSGCARSHDRLQAAQPIHAGGPRRRGHLRLVGP